MTELHCLIYCVGVLSGIGISLVICRFIPQRVEVFMPMRPPGFPPDSSDSSEAWKGGQ